MKTRIKIHNYKEVDSTNEVLKKLAREGASEYTLVIAERQTAGHGRFGRSWESDSGGLWMSLLLRPDIPPEKVPIISLVASLAVAKTIHELTQLDPQTKWPNDVIVNGKKVSGILPESVLHGEKLDYLILGIGINVNQESFPEELKGKATSIQLEIGTHFPKEHILERFISVFSDLYFEMIEEGTHRIIEEWKDLCPMLGKDIVIQEGNMRFRGIMRGISPDGYLVMEKYDGKQVNIFAGEATCID